jgi:D-alanyl-D-alanine carboxypeptidase
LVVVVATAFRPASRASSAKALINVLFPPPPTRVISSLEERDNASMIEQVLLLEIIIFS